MDRTNILIDCTNKTIDVTDPDFDYNIIDSRNLYAIEEKKSAIIANILLKTILDLVKKDYNELLNINLQIITGDCNEE